MYISLICKISFVQEGDKTQTSGIFAKYCTISLHRRPFMSFASLGLSETLLKTITEQNYTQPYPIQAQAIPAILSGKDILGIAKTGSGKTAGFVLPILELFQNKTVPKNRFIRALVLVPTRELALQIGVVFQTFGEKLPRKVKTLAVYGGVSINPQMIALQGVEILVATPGPVT